MPYDPNLPQAGTEIDAVQMRGQLKGLNDLIVAVPTISSAVVDAVSTLPAGEAASVSATITEGVLHLSFGIPEGPSGPPGEVTHAELDAAVAATLTLTSSNSNAVSLLGETVDSSYNQTQIQGVINKPTTRSRRQTRRRPWSRPAGPTCSAWRSCAATSRSSRRSPGSSRAAWSTRALVGPTSAGAVAMFEVSDVDTLRVVVDVPDSYAGDVAPGIAADIYSPRDPARTVAGTVTPTSGVLEQDTRTLRIELHVPGAGVLLPGSFVYVRLHVPRDRPAPVIPAGALVVRKEGTLVARVVDGVVTMVPVKLGRDFGKEIEVLDGVAPGDEVVVSPSDTLESGVIESKKQTVLRWSYGVCEHASFLTIHRVHLL